MRPLPALLVLLTQAVLAGCVTGELTGVPPGTGPGPGDGAFDGQTPIVSRDSSPLDASADDLQFCVDEINRYRDMVGRPHLRRSATLEAFAAMASQVDGDAHEAHKYFQDTAGGGVATAENEIPWWELSRYGSVREVLRAGLALMWAEGEGGPHRETMAGPSVDVGCGVYVNGDEITSTQDYR